MQKLKLIFVLFLLSTICWSGFVRAEKPSEKEDIKSEINLKNVTLELYYLDPSVLTRKPLTVDDLVESCDTHVVVEPDTLYENRQTIFEMLDTSTVPMEGDAYLNARVYYVMKSTNGKTLFEVAMWGENGSIFVNGVKCHAEKVFYDVALKFLPGEGRQGDGSFVLMKERKSDEKYEGIEKTG